MKKRIITALVLALIMIPLAFFMDKPVFYMFFALISAFSGYELTGCTGVRKNIAVSFPVMLVCALFPLLCGMLDEDILLKFTAPVFSLLLLWFASVYVVIAARTDTENNATHTALSQICITVFFAFYIAFGFAFMVLMGTDGNTGLFEVILVFVISYATDTCAYFSGMLFGKHKLIPRVSPKKTVEGAIGGTLMAVVLTVVYGFIVSACVPGISFSLPALIAVGLVGSVVSQFGDLLMSALKRNYGIKDFGWILPGHGGILDRFDSVLAVSVLTYSFSSFFSIFS